MGAPDVLGLLTTQGLTIRPRADGNLEVSPRRLLTDETRRLIREHKAELLEVLACTADGLLDPAAEARRQRVLSMLARNPTARYAVLTAPDADPEAAILALAIRGLGLTCELRIPRERYDPFLLLDSHLERLNSSARLSDIEADGGAAVATDAELPDPSELSGHWLISLQPARMERWFSPPATRAELQARYPGATLIALPEASGPATMQEISELDRLIAAVAAQEGFSEAEHAEALHNALRDPERALRCFRALLNVGYT